VIEKGQGKQTHAKKFLLFDGAETPLDLTAMLRAVTLLRFFIGSRYTSSSTVFWREDRFFARGICALVSFAARC
jgi:hypothetical protein